MWHLVGKASWGGSQDCLAWWFWFGGVVGWCSWCSAAATGEPLDGSSNRLHEAEQKVSFKGEAVGGTVGKGVAGWRSISSIIDCGWTILFMSDRLRTRRDSYRGLI